MRVETASALGSVLALLVTIFICVYVLPAGKEGKFTGFLKTIRDYFLMRYLIVEGIVRFFFVLATTSCIFSGFFLMFTKQSSWYGGSRSNFFVGLATMIFGPIVCRIVYELLMIAILQLKNIIEINNKMPGQVKGDIYKVPAPTPLGQPVQQPVAQPVQQPVQPAAPFQAYQQPVAQQKPVQPAVSVGGKFDPITGQPIEQPQTPQEPQNPVE